MGCVSFCVESPVRTFLRGAGSDERHAASSLSGIDSDVRLFNQGSLGTNFDGEGRRTKSLKKEHPSNGNRRNLRTLEHRIGYGQFELIQRGLWEDLADEK